MVINAAFETQKSQKNWFHVKSEWQKENKKIYSVSFEPGSPDQKTNGLPMS